MAVVGCNLQRSPLRALLRAVQFDVVLLDCADPADRCDLVLRDGVTSWLASKLASWLRRWPDVFLDRILLAHDGHRSGLVRPGILHGDLLRVVGVVLRPRAATSRKK